MVGLVVASVLAGVAYSKEAYPLSRLPWEALMLHRWWWTDFFGWNFPDWSISAEWFAYLFIFPLAVWLLKKLERQNWVVTIVALLGLIALEPAIRTEWKLPMVSLLFLAGAMVWELRRRLAAMGKIIWSQSDLVAALFLILVLWFERNLGSVASASLFLVAVAWLIFSLSQKSGVIAKCLTWGPVLFLGEISYSIYLTHGISQRVLKIILSAEKFASSSLMVRLALCAAYVIFIFALSLAMYFLIERPARVWLRQLKTVPKPMA
jgi:peptidoglycan/LPS O-acetylase OafA/YrhL